MGTLLVPKLKHEHISLTAFSKMCVDLAAQVLSVFLNKACLETNFALCIKVFSSSVSKALPLVCGDKARETAHFVGLVDKFFDIMNVQNFSKGRSSMKPFQLPFRSAEDFRLKV